MKKYDGDEEGSGRICLCFVWRRVMCFCGNFSMSRVEKKKRWKESPRGSRRERDLVRLQLWAAFFSGSAALMSRLVPRS